MPSNINVYYCNLKLMQAIDFQEMMKKNGDFLVRTTEPVAGQARAFVLSIMLNAPLEEQGVSPLQ